MPRPSLKELLDCPQLAGWRLLQWRYERARPLGAPLDRLTLMEELMKESLAKDAGRDGAVVPQVNSSGYAGPLIEDRFQVMASVIGQTFYICDHARDDLLHRVAGPGSDVQRFNSIEEANQFIKQCPPPLPRGSNFSWQPTSGMPGQENDMAKTAGGLKAARKAASEADKAIGPTKKATAAPPAAKRGNAEALKKARESRGPTAAGRFRELIMDATTLKGVKTCKLTDAEIFAKVAEEFGLDEKKASYVAWYRKDLEKKGTEVPAARA